MFWKKILSGLLGVALFGLSQAKAAPDEERYYMLVFGQQDEANSVRASHTFAVFVKATGGENAGDRFESHCISWIAKALVIDPMHRMPEVGVNLNLADSLKQAKAVKANVTLWGPYRVKKELYDMAVVQEKRLNAGAIEYVLIDTSYRGKKASNCMHAVSDLETTRPALDTGTAYGNAGSELVANYFQQYTIPSQESMEWLLKRLKIDPKVIRFATLGTARVGK